MRTSGLRVGGALCAVVLLSGSWVAPAVADEGHDAWWPQTEATPTPEVHDPAEHETHEPAEHETHEAEDPAHDEDTHDSTTDDHGTDDHGTDDHGTDDHGTDEPVDRPLPVVLGAFGTLNGGVLLFAAVTRRRERAAREAKQAERAQRRSVPATARKEPS